MRLNEEFWRSLRKHPVPVREQAVKAIGIRSVAMGVYIWLAYRLHSLDQVTPVSWPALHAQFGAGMKALRHSKPVFMEAFRLAMAAYPPARVESEHQRRGMKEFIAAKRQLRSASVLPRSQFDRPTCHTVPSLVVG